MNFLNPLALVGLAAAAVPILLHLLNLRKLRTVDFSTLEFLKELKKTRIRKLRLKQWLLLLLRVLLVIALALAFARPTVDVRLPGVSAASNTSIVILLDNSFSMDLADVRGSRIKQAREAALRLVGSLRDGDEVALIPMASPDDMRFGDLSRDRSALADALPALETSFSAARLGDALRRASAALSDARHAHKQVFVITDMQKNIAADIDSLALFDGSVQTWIVPVGESAASIERNLSIDSVGMVTTLFESGRSVDVTATVHNHGESDVQGVITGILFNDERMSQQAPDLPAGGSVVVSLQGTPRAEGVVRGAVEIEGDALTADDKRWFGFIVPQKPRVSLFGSPQGARFVQLALGGGGDSSLRRSQVETFSLDKLAAVDLSSRDVVALVGVPALSRSDAARLSAWVEGGGGLLLFGTPDTDLEAAKALFELMGLGLPERRAYKQGGAARFTAIDAQHPLFDGVFKKGEQISEAAISPSITEALVAVGIPAVAAVGDGAVIAEKPLGQGRVVWCGLAPTLEGSNFPVTGFFVSFVHRSVSYLSAKSSISATAEVGQPVTVRMPPRTGTGIVSLVEPDGTISSRRTSGAAGSAVLQLEGLRMPGVYVVQTPEGRPLATIAVNAPASESVLDRTAPEDLAVLLAPVAGSADRVRVVPSAASELSLDELRTVGVTELWSLFALLALLFALSEMAVARSMAREAA